MMKSPTKLHMFDISSYTASESILHVRHLLGGLVLPEKSNQQNRFVSALILL